MLMRGQPIPLIRASPPVKLPRNGHKKWHFRYSTRRGIFKFSVAFSGYEAGKVFFLE